MADEVTPVAPAEPVAPAAPTADEVAAEAEANEWADAAEEAFPGLKTPEKKEEDKPDEPAKPEKADEKVPADKEAAKVDPAKKDETEPDEATEEESEPPDTTARDVRVAQRATAQEAATVKADVQEKMFKDAPTQLQDADGDPIKSIDDVMKLVNPRTKEPFTEEEAGQWLLSAQQQFNQHIAQQEKTIEQITEVNMDLKDQADNVTFQYGELLKELPELRDELWAEYEKTLVKDDKTGLIIKAPMSLENFYNIALKPYVEMATKLESDDAAKVAAEAQTAAEQDKAKKTSRQDRSDIYGGGKVDEMDSEEKEWSDAAKAVFGK